MHEFFVVQNIIRSVEELMEQYPGKKVVKVVLLIGKFSGVEPDLLKTALDFFKKGSVISEAEVVIETEELKLRCNACGKEFVKDKWDLMCPFCNSLNTEVIAGDQMLLKSVELE